MKTFMIVIAALGILQAYAQNEATIETPTVIVGVSPHSFSLTRGSVLAGGIWDLTYSDNLSMALRPDYGRGMPAQIMLEGRLPVDPTGLSLTIETHATLPNVRQTVAMWDWDARAWAILGSDTVGAWDTQLEYAVSGDILRFSEAGTGRMQAAIAFAGSGPFWQARLDTAFWTYSR